jgi:hypothetical protein
MVIPGELNRAFVVGSVGATIATLALLVMSRADSEMKVEKRAAVKATSDCISGRQPTAGTFTKENEVITLNR